MTHPVKYDRVVLSIFWIWRFFFAVSGTDESYFECC